MMTVSAACRFSPTPPALTLSRNTETAEPAADTGSHAADVLLLELELHSSQLKCYGKQRQPVLGENICTMTTAVP